MQSGVDVARTLYLLILILLTACGGNTGHMDILTPNAAHARPDAANGLNYLHYGLTNEAQPLMDRAVSEAPNDPLVLDAMGFYQEKTGRVDVAQSYFVSAMTLAPDSGTIRNNYAAFLCRNGFYKQSIPFFIRATEIPHYANAPTALANARYCHELMATTLGDRSEYAYYTRLLWASTPTDTGTNT